MAKNPDPHDVRMSFGGHLEELRGAIIRALVGVLIGTMLCFWGAKHIFSFVMRPAWLVLSKYDQNPTLQSLSPPDTFLLYIKIALICGIIVSSPWVFIQIWSFVGAGLYERERRYAKLAILPSVVLFILGVVFMYYIVLPIVLNFFVSFNLTFPIPDWEPNRLERLLLGKEDVIAPSPLEDALNIPMLASDPENPGAGSLWFNQSSGYLKLSGPDGQMYQTKLRAVENVSAISNQYSIEFYTSFILRLSLAFGLAFQVPIVVIFLAISGIATVEGMAKARGYVILSFTILSALLTPPDVISQILLAVPMVILFEGGLVTSRMILKRRAEAAE